MNINIDTDVNESRFDDLAQYYEITTPELLDELIGVPIILNHYTENINDLLERIVTITAMCWGNEDERGNLLHQRLIPFKVDADDEVTYHLQLNRLMVVLTFIKPIIKYIDFVDIEDFLLTDAITEKRSKEILDVVGRTLGSYGYPLERIKEVVADWSLDYKQITCIFGLVASPIFDACNLILDWYRQSPIIRELNNTYYPPSMQPSEIVEANKKAYERLEKEMFRLKAPFFMCNKYTKILKPKQMEELYINFSLTQDGDKMITVQMNGNGYNQGYHEREVLYAGAISARVPDMMNKDYMGIAGYFNHNLMMLSYGTLSPTVDDCGSQNPIEITLTEDNFNMFLGRNYYRRKGEILKVIKEKDKKDLIGRTVWMRSPCTCNLKEDVCHACYGTIALKVGHLKGGFIYTTEICTSKVQQNVLSVKHILKTNAEKIVGIDDNFNDYFVLDSSQIYPQDIKFDMFIREDYTDHISEYFEMFVSKKLIPIKITNYASCHVNDELFDKEDIVEIKGVRYYKLNSKTVLGTNRPICDIIPVNIAETQKYMNIMNMFESKLSSYTRIEDAVNDLNAMFKNTIPLLSTHGEIMISKHIRQKDNRMLRPNFLKPNAEYQILNLRMALQNSESVATALAFEHTKAHLMQSISETREDIKSVGARSFIDYLLGEEVL